MHRLFARLSTLAVIHRIAFGVCLGQVNVPPNAVTLLFGKVEAGNVASLAAPDSDVLRMTWFSVPNNSVDPVNFRVEGKLPFRPVGMTFNLTSRAVHAGMFRQSLNLYDWTKNLFDPLSNVNGPMHMNFTDMQCPAQGDVGRYVRASDNKVMALVRARPVGPVAVLQWEVEYDAASFTIVSGP
jgi:hypothetical protein